MGSGTAGKHGCRTARARTGCTRCVRPGPAPTRPRWGPHCARPSTGAARARGPAPPPARSGRACASSARGATWPCNTPATSPPRHTTSLAVPSCQSEITELQQQGRLVPTLNVKLSICEPLSHSTARSKHWQRTQGCCHHHCVSDPAPCRLLHSKQPAKDASSTDMW